MNYFISKIGYTILVLIGITLISFVLANASNIDPAEAFARREFRGASEEKVNEVRTELGFNESIPRQYLNWIRKAIQLDFGNSYVTGKPVISDLLNVFPVTLLIAIIAAVFMLMIAIPLGIISAVYAKGMIPSIISVFSFSTLSIPGYFWGLIFVYLLGYKAHLFPVIGHGDIRSIIFASLVLAMPMIGSLSKMLRSLILQYQQADFVMYARARGISRKGIMLRHLLRNAAPPCLTMFGQNIGYLIAGTAIVENIFSCSGLGTYAISAALNRDFPVVTAYMFLMALLFVVCNLAADFGSHLLNPKSLDLQGRNQ